MWEDSRQSGKGIVSADGSGGDLGGQLRGAAWDGSIVSVPMARDPLRG